MPLPTVFKTHSALSLALALHLLMGGMGFAQPGSGVPAIKASEDKAPMMAPALPEFDPTHPLLPKAAPKAKRKVRVEELTRAEGALNLVENLGFTMRYVCEFPTFVDVGTQHPFYNAIETSRIYGLMDADAEGYFHPDEPMTSLDAYHALFTLLRPKHLDPETVQQALAPYTDATTLSPQDRFRAARLILEGIILPPGQPGPAGTVGSEYLNPETPMTNKILYYMAKRTKSQMYVVAKAEGVDDGELLVNSLPSDILLMISPTQAIFKADLQAGKSFFFTLLEPVALSDTDILPRGSRVEAMVTVANIDEAKYTLEFNRLITPSDEGHYRFQGKLDLDFSKQKNTPLPWLISGQTFEVITATIPVLGQ